MAKMVTPAVGITDLGEGNGLRCRQPEQINGGLQPVSERWEARRQDHQRNFEFSDPVGFSNPTPSWPWGGNQLSEGIQCKLRVVSLLAPSLQMDETRLLGRCGMMVTNLDCFGDGYPPVDLDSGSVRVRRRPARGG